MKILDIGCGYCYLTRFLKGQGYDVLGVDFFYGTIPEDRCRQSEIPYYQLNIETDDLPFEENIFDVVLLGEVLEHLTHSPLLPLARIQNALKRGGRLILTTPNVRRVTHLAKMVVGQNIYPDLTTYCREPYVHEGKEFYY
jgi:2-polyprenyl-3-methyl-5-hydroxy-6-metoxy-1,4-benzoquinol methylase